MYRNIFAWYLKHLRPWTGLRPEVDRKELSRFSTIVENRDKVEIQPQNLEITSLGLPSNNDFLIELQMGG